MEINEHSVIVREGISRVEESGTDEKPGFTGWLIEKETVYDKDEYIQIMDETNKALEQQATDLQLALTEVYEMML